MKIQCIYKIINTKTNQIYIGSTLDFEWRKKKHIYQLKKNIHHSRYLQNAWNFYGIDCFEFSIIERIEDKNQLVIREDFYIRSLNPDYNTMREVKSHIGLKRSEETKRKMSLAQVGKNHTEETKEKIRKISLGKKQSEETIQKRVESHFKSILQLDKNGTLIKEWKSATHAETESNFKRKSIYRCLWGERKSYKDFIWKYKE
jgi:group I intron endonuclease